MSGTDIAYVPIPPYAVSSTHTAHGPTPLFSFCCVGVLLRGLRAYGPLASYAMSGIIDIAYGTSCTAVWRTW
eukprot:2537010-Rhodomonas_salina.8